MTEAGNNGAAPDGDEDGILGMILIALALKDENTTDINFLRKFAYDSCRAFVGQNTAKHPNLLNSRNASARIVKLGSC